MTTLPGNDPTPAPGMDQLVFVGFRSRVIALNRDTGEIVWSWKSPSGSGYVAVLVDGDRLIVSVSGYTYCLNPETGEVLWFNPLVGMGIGVPCIATVRGNTMGQYTLLAGAAADDANRHAAGSP